MKWLWSFAALLVLTASGMSQEVLPAPRIPAGDPQPLPDSPDSCVFPSTDCCREQQAAFSAVPTSSIASSAS